MKTFSQTQLELPLPPLAENNKPIYLNLKETNNLICAELKRNFPKNKFSVLSQSGNATHVTWICGPGYYEVADVISHLQGEYFDRSINLSCRHKHYALQDGTVIYAGTDGTTKFGGIIDRVDIACPAGARLMHLGNSVIFYSRRSKRR